MAKKISPRTQKRACRQEDIGDERNDLISGSMVLSLTPAASMEVVREETLMYGVLYHVWVRGHQNIIQYVSPRGATCFCSLYTRARKWPLVVSALRAEALRATNWRMICNFVQCGLHFGCVDFLPNSVFTQGTCEELM